MPIARVLVLVVIAATLLVSRGARAHGFTPSLLELRELGRGTVEVLQKTPANAEGRALHAVLPAACVDKGPHQTFDVGPDRLEGWSVACPGGLSGATLRFEGFSGIGEEVLVRVDLEDGTHLDAVARARSPEIAIPARQAWHDVARAYVGLGIEHILTGYDHLAFVLGLLLLVRTWRALFVTVTSFTLAHSVTLSLAALGIVRAPTRAVEAVIALSIVLVAAELARPPAAPARTPAWAMAFLFGLLHGFGFAGALVDLGLSARQVPAALVGFNAGVELGQLAMVAPVFALKRAAERWAGRFEGHAVRALAYVLGASGAFLCFQRVVAYFE